tara:strand:- start:1156 stop:2076 length:921 start_codon:yes stop_codon:yes gene_type:complete
MKHNIKITALLVLIFLLAQFVGLVVINRYIDISASKESKTTQWKPLPFNFERPDVPNKSISFIPLMIGLLIGTGLFFLLAKFNNPFILKIWFFVVILITLTFSFNAFTTPWTAGIVALTLTLYRVFKPNLIVHNFTEIFIYGGLAAFIVPIFNIFGGIVLLILISIYDAIAVWKTKHMVTLAEFQKKSKIFAGLMISYDRNEPKPGKQLEKQTETKHPTKIISKQTSAILGGGDIGFPLIFAGIVMKSMMLTETMTITFLKTSIIPITTAIALLLLLTKGKKDKYYPAMPFLSAGSILGYIIILLI